MKHIFAFLTLFVLATPADAKEWTKTNTVMEIADWGLMWLDYKQTTRFLKPDMNHYENGPAKLFLGKYPSRSRLINVGLIYGLTHTLISVILPPKWRKHFQALTTIGRFNFVIHNHQAGIKIDF